MPSRHLRNLRRRWGELLRSPGARRGLRHGFAAAGMAAIILLVHRQVTALVVREAEAGWEADRSIAHAELPAWFDEMEGAGELKAILRELDATLCDDEAVTRAYERLAHQPWIRRVRFVRRTGLRGLEIDFDLRQPVAAVHQGTYHVLVDGERVRLPGEYVALPAAVPGPVLDVPEAAPPVGETWNSPALDAALEILALHDESPLLRRLGIARIRVEGRATPRLTLVLDNGTRIVWGSPPSGEEPGEPTHVEKLAMLRNALATHPDLRGIASVRLDIPAPAFGQRPR